MTALAARGVGSIRAVRTGIELTALTTGWLLGGSVGLGTVAFAVAIGPLVQACLPRLALPDPPAGAPGAGAPGPAPAAGALPTPADGGGEPPDQ